MTLDVVLEVVLDLDVRVLIAVLVACEVDVVSNSKVMSCWALKYFNFQTSSVTASESEMQLRAENCWLTLLLQAFCELYAAFISVLALPPIARIS